MDKEKKRKIEYAIEELYFNRQIGIEEEEKRILRIRYEEELDLLKPINNQMGLREESLVIKIEDAQGKVQYEVYSVDDRENPIAIIEQDGEISFKEAYLEKLKERFGAFYNQLKIELRQEKGEKIDVDALEENAGDEKQGKRTIIEKQYPEEIEKERKNEKSKQEEKEVKTEEEEKEQLEEDLHRQGIEGKIAYIVDITDSSFYKEVPQAQKYKGIFACAKFVCFADGSSMVVGEKEGVYVPIEGCVQSSKTVEDVSYISPDGNKVEDRQMRGLMTMENSQMAFAYKIGQYGEPEFSKMYFNKKTGQYEFAAPMETKKNYQIEDKVQKFIGEKNRKGLEKATNTKKKEEKMGEKPRNIEALGNSKGEQVEGIYKHMEQKANIQGKLIGKEEEAEIKWKIAVQLERMGVFSEQMEQEVLDGLAEREEQEQEERTIYSDAEQKRKRH